MKALPTMHAVEVFLRKLKLLKEVPAVRYNKWTVMVCGYSSLNMYVL